MPYCEKCGERLEGDGYTRVLHCPYADYETYDSLEPDAAPVMCTFSDETEQEQAELDLNVAN